jgi:hypothetical protein
METVVKKVKKVTFNLDPNYHWYHWYICETCNQEFRRRGKKKKKPWKRNNKLFCSLQCVVRYQN